jgi:hypothetical protein
MTRYRFCSALLVAAPRRTAPKRRPGSQAQGGSPGSRGREQGAAAHVTPLFSIGIFLFQTEVVLARALVPYQHTVGWERELSVYINKQLSIDYIPVPPNFPHIADSNDHNNEQLQVRKVREKPRRRGFSSAYHLRLVVGYTSLRKLSLLISILIS